MAQDLGVDGVRTAPQHAVQHRLKSSTTLREQQTTHCEDAVAQDLGVDGVHSASGRVCHRPPPLRHELQNELHSRRSAHGRVMCLLWVWHPPATSAHARPAAAAATRQHAQRLCFLQNKRATHRAALHGRVG